MNPFTPSKSESPSASFDVRRQELSPVVRSYIDTLYVQIRLIFDKYGVKNIEDLRDGVKDKKIKMESKDGERLKQLTRWLRDTLKEKKIPKEAFIGIETAQEIMGEDLYGPKEIEDAFSIKVEESEIPPIPYSPEQLMKAKELGEMLILRFGHDAEGNPLTMERMNGIMKTRMDKDKEGKLLHDTDWYKDEDFYRNDLLKTEWRLVGGSFIEGSTNQNYVHQTRLLRDYLKSVGSLSEEEEQECSDETLRRLSGQMGFDWDSQKITDRAKYDANWKEVARKLAGLKVNANHRRSPAEIIYDWTMRFKKTKDRGILEDNYDWSRTFSSDGALVYVGYVDSVGARVSRWIPDGRFGGLGVVPLR